jgi:hypothetical protein
MVEEEVHKGKKTSTQSQLRKRSTILIKKEIIETIREMNEQAMQREEKRMNVMMNIQKEMSKQHQERMEAIYALINI